MTSLTRSGYALIVCLFLLNIGCPAAAMTPKQLYPYVQAFFPQATGIGVMEGEPPAARIEGPAGVLGYCFLTDDIAPIPAYSGKPVSVLVGLDIAGEVRGIRIIHHEEPILKAGVSEAQLHAFVEQYHGLSAHRKIKVGGLPRPGYQVVDAMTGATITTIVVNATIQQSIQAVKAAYLTDSKAASGVAEKAQPVWRLIWQERKFQIGVLVVALSMLTLILLFQDWLAQHPRLLLYVRDGFLVFTVVFIGWYSLAQLSVINVLTFIQALTHDFRWDTFLIDPVLFIVWSFVAVTLLLWGRGVYCGWLCPFGALQELLNQLARRLHVRQWEFPAVVHERLWALKYVILLVLFGISLQSLDAAQRLAEIEPFKTAVVLHFVRSWPFLLYALGLLAVTLVNRKFFCKYLCPLGAALAIPARNRLFDWLRRRKECGRPCRICEQECEVRAIKETGEININECHYCLDCQVTFWNERKCPPLAEKRKKRERAMRRKPSAAFLAVPIKVESSAHAADARPVSQENE